MNPDNIPFNALIVAATNCGKTSFLVKILTHEFLGAFDYIFLALFVRRISITKLTMDLLKMIVAFS